MSLLPLLAEKKTPADENRVLIFAPTGQDARLTSNFLAERNLSVEPCWSMEEVCKKIEEGCGTVLLAEEILSPESLGKFFKTLEDQPSWSDIPITIITGKSELIQRRLRRLATSGSVGNIGLLERPFHPETLLSTMEVAIRARKRQYQVRDLLAKQKASESRLQNILESISDAFVALDKYWRFTYINRSYMALFSNLFHSPDELLGQDFWDKFPDIIGSESGRFYVRAMAEQKPGVLEFFYKPIGRWLEIHAYPSPETLSLYVRDITERKATEEALQAARTQIESTLYNAEIGTWDWNVQNDLVKADRNLARLFYFNPAEEFEGAIHLFFDAIHAEDRARVEAQIAATLKNGQGDFYTDFRVAGREGGKFRWVTARGKVQYDHHGNAVRFPGVVMDITERKRHEESLANLSFKIEEQARLFDATLSNMSDLAYVFDREARIIYANKPLLDIWGRKLEEVVGKNVYDLNYPADIAPKIHGELLSVATSGKPVRGETNFTSAAGVEDIHEYIFNPVFGPEGNVVAVAGTSRLITERKRNEAMIHEAKDAAEAANRAKDRFLAVLSHELRTPLTPVLMTVASLEVDPSYSAEARETFSMIRRNVELETKLIDDLLDLNRVASGKLALHLEPVNLNAAIRHAISICSQQFSEKEVNLHIHLDNEAGFVMADPARFRQVLWNLFNNSIKFTPAKGTIHVVTSRLPDGRGRVEVSDDGIGITPEVLPRIFNAFEQGEEKITRKFGGLGLGLAICKALVDLHHGTIRAESDGSGKGSRFVVELPGAECPADRTLLPASEQNLPSHKLRLLIVEDHGDTAKALARLLQRSGYLVDTAGDVATALALAETHQFDLLISDLGLPDASGYELMRRLREINDIKGIAMSGFGMDDDVKKSREAGFSEHLVKPVNVMRLREAIRRVAEENPSEI